MAETTQLRVFVKGNRDLTDLVLARSDGGGKLDAGVAERVAQRFPSVALTVGHAPSTGFQELRAELAGGASSLLEFEPDIVLLSVAGDIERICESSSAEVIPQIKEDLVGSINLIKEKSGAHILIANASTVDPEVPPVHDYSRRDREPFSLAAHRMAYMLVRTSHAEGISIIDVDTLLAGLGADDHVKGALTYSEQACGAIADEVVRVLEDYGFFDERNVIEQVGAAQS